MPFWNERVLVIIEDAFSEEVCMFPWLLSMVAFVKVIVLTAGEQTMLRLIWRVLTWIWGVVMELLTRLPVERVLVLIVDATNIFVLMKDVGDRLWIEFCTAQEEVVKVDATNDVATMEEATCSVFV